MRQDHETTPVSAVSGRDPARLEAMARQHSLQTAMVREATTQLLQLARQGKPARMTAFCARLHRLAADLERVPGDPSAATLARLADLCADVIEGSLPDRMDGDCARAVASGNGGMAVGPGGLGYMLTLSTEEEETIAPRFGE